MAPRLPGGRDAITGDSDDSYDSSELDSFVAKLRKGYGLRGFSRQAMPGLELQVAIKFGSIGIFNRRCRNEEKEGLR